MAEHEDKENEVTGSEAANQNPPAKIENELPMVASPSISPAVASGASASAGRSRAPRRAPDGLPNPYRSISDEFDWECGPSMG